MKIDGWQNFKITFNRRQRPRITTHLMRLFGDAAGRWTTFAPPGAQHAFVSFATDMDAMTFILVSSDCGVHSVEKVE